MATKPSFIHASSILVERLIADIAAARSQVHLLYYILSPDETGLKVIAALESAARRGVRCRLLADAVASRPLFNSDALERLKAAGVEVAAALAL
jgi:cardiolipin synthase